MNKRIAAFTLCLLYLTFAVIAGTLPHNHSGGNLLAHKDCVACAAHTNGVSDVPVTIVEAPHAPVEFATFSIETFSPSALLFASTASRAPPHTSA